MAQDPLEEPRFPVQPSGRFPALVLSRRHGIGRIEAVPPMAHNRARHAQGRIEGVLFAALTKLGVGDHERRLETVQIARRAGHGAETVGLAIRQQHDGFRETERHVVLDQGLCHDVEVRVEQRKKRVDAGQVRQSDGRGWGAVGWRRRLLYA